MILEVHQGKGLRYRLMYEKQKNIQSYCIENAIVMEKWCDWYMEARKNDGSLPIIPMQSWIFEVMVAKRSNGETVSINARLVT